MHLLITAGPTHEAIDPVRFIGNRSSGKMGFALAEAAIAAGHEVTLIAGPVHLPTPEGVTRVDVTSAADMFDAVERTLNDHPIGCAILCAAVADFTPATTAGQKIKKTGKDKMSIELVPTKDILGSMRDPLGFTGTLVGFAAETTDVLTYASDKLTRKRCDFIVANDVSQPGIGFDSNDNAVTVLGKDGPQWSASGSKRDLATRIIATVAG